jgi:hypothetical protein
MRARHLACIHASKLHLALKRSIRTCILLGVKDQYTHPESVLIIRVSRPIVAVTIRVIWLVGFSVEVVLPGLMQ